MKLRLHLNDWTDADERRFQRRKLQLLKEHWIRQAAIETMKEQNAFNTDNDIDILYCNPGRCTSMA